ncbi:MAG: hypothetical protein IT350_10215 [Deltaproteobacteria bacterium]|nr:hypothetical protein [Deltaproteobacteria bacterium]
MALWLALLVFTAGCGGGDDENSRGGTVDGDDDAADDDDYTPGDDDGTDDDSDDDTDDDSDDDTGDDDAGDDDTADDDTGDDDTGDDDTGDDDTGDDDTGDDDTEDATVTLHVTDGETQDDIEGATCTLIDSESGQPVAPENSDESDADGICTLTLAAGGGVEAIRITATDYVTAYNFEVATNATVEQILVKEASRNALAALLSVTIDPADGLVIGVVLWSSESGVDFVGCTEIANDSGQNDVFYSDDSGAPGDSRTSTNPVNSSYLLFNVPAGGPYTFTGDTAGDIVENVAPKVFAEAMTFVYLIYDAATWPTNPTPGGCS